MASGFIVRLRPSGPWRLGPSSGARDRVDRVLHSDTLYSALTIAADQIGILDAWLDATARSAEPVVRVGSAYPFVGRTLLAPAPRHVWPPATSGRTRWKAARFVPLHVVPRLLAYESLKEDRWAVDPVSESVLPVEKFGEVTPPFRVTMRRTAAVDRISGVSGDSASTACLEFAENAGMWCPVFCPHEWRERVQSLFRFIADAGVGGERSSGWGKSGTPEFEELPGALAAEASDATEHHEVGFWMLSLFAPAAGDRVDWSRGSYALVRRSGRTQDWGTLKVESAMVEEGSVVMAELAPAGFARDIAPEGAAHPVYRAGFAVAVPVPMRLPGFYERERAIAAEAAPAEIPVAVAAAVVADDEFPPPEAPPAETAEPQVADAGGPEESLAEPIEDAPAQPESVPEPEPFSAETGPVAEQILPTPTADSGAFEDGPALPDAGGPEESTAEPIEDALAQPESVPEPEPFTAETSPVAEQILPADTADGGAFEDGPFIPDADGEKPEDAQ